MNEKIKKRKTLLKKLVIFSQIGYNGRKQMWGKRIFDLLTLVSKIQIKGARVWNIMRSAENASWNL